MSQWDHYDTIVACKMLGFSAAEQFYNVNANNTGSGNKQIYSSCSYYCTLSIYFFQEPYLSPTLVVLGRSLPCLTAATALSAVLLAVLTPMMLESSVQIVRQHTHTLSDNGLTLLNHSAWFVLVYCT